MNVRVFKFLPLIFWMSHCWICIIFVCMWMYMGPYYNDTLNFILIHNIIHICVYMSICMCMCMCMCTCMCMCMCLCMCVCVCVCVYVCVCVRVCVCVLISTTDILNVILLDLHHMCTCTYVYICVHISAADILNATLLNLYHMCVYTYKHICAHISATDILNVTLLNHIKYECIYSRLHLECHFFILESQSTICFSRSLFNLNLFREIPRNLSFSIWRISGMQNFQLKVSHPHLFSRYSEYHIAESVS